MFTLQLRFGNRNLSMMYTFRTPTLVADDPRLAASSVKHHGRHLVPNVYQTHRVFGNSRPLAYEWEQNTEPMTQLFDVSKSKNVILR